MSLRAAVSAGAAASVLLEGSREAWAYDEAAAALWRAIRVALGGDAGWACPMARAADRLAIYSARLALHRSERPLTQAEMDDADRRVLEDYSRAATAVAKKIGAL